MTKYKNFDKDSGVSEFQISENSISVKFAGANRIYKYTVESAGRDNIEEMKVLAQNGAGLNSYINRYVKNNYEM